MFEKDEIMSSIQVHNSMNALLKYETITMDGAVWKMKDGKESGLQLEPDDVYYAGRNGEHILTVREVDKDLGCVHAQEVAYSYNLWECIGVERVN